MKADPQAFSDDDAEQFADAFKPAWDTPDEDSTAVSAPPSAVAAHDAQAAEEPAVVSSTMVMERPPGLDLAPTEKAPVPVIAKDNMKRTVIGMAAPPAPLPPEAVPLGLSAEVTPKEVKRPQSSSESIEADQILSTAPAPAVMPFSSATSSPNVAGLAASASAGVYTMGMGTQVMNNRPVPSRPPGPTGYVASRPPQAPAAAALTDDPFRTRAGSSSDFDGYKPKKSNKAIVIGVIGVMALIGLGVGLKAVISDDAADKPKAEQLVTGPAATTAEIPPPPPASEPAPAAKTAEPTSTTTTAAAIQPPAPTALAVPPQPQHATQQAAPPPAPLAPPRNDPPRGRPAAAPPPPPQPAAPKSPTKAGNGGIVRDNPF